MTEKQVLNMHEMIDRPSDDFDETATPIWEELAAIGRSAPEGTWEAVPDDLSTRIDEVVYGTGAARE